MQAVPQITHRGQPHPRKALRFPAMAQAAAVAHRQQPRTLAAWGVQDKSPAVAAVVAARLSMVRSAALVAQAAKAGCA